MALIDDAHRAMQKTVPAHRKHQSRDGVERGQGAGERADQGGAVDDLGDGGHAGAAADFDERRGAAGDDSGLVVYPKHHRVGDDHEK